MILVKSLVVLFLLLLAAHYYNKIFNKPPKKEGFTSVEEEEETEEDMEELSYTTLSPMEKHAEMAIDSQLVSELQDKMKELMKLSEEATEINKTLE